MKKLIRIVCIVLKLAIVMVFLMHATTAGNGSRTKGGKLFWLRYATAL